MKPAFKIELFGPSAPTPTGDGGTKEKIKALQAEIDAGLKDLSPKQNKVRQLINQSDDAAAAGDTAKKNALLQEAKTLNDANQKQLEELQAKDAQRKALVQQAENYVPPSNDITALISDRLISLTITDEAGVKSDRLEITLDDRDQRLSIPPTKAVIKASIGYAGKPLVEKGQYTVEEIALEGPERRMVIRANSSEASKGAGAARERSWDDTTIGQIARSIASKHGWLPAISDAIDGIKIDHIDQHENDLQFLARVAMDNGAVAKVTHGRLVVAPHAEGKAVSGKVLPVIAVTADQTTEWNLLIAERGDYKGVKAIYHDLKTGKRGEAIDGEDGENTHELPHQYATKAAAERAAKAKKKSLERDKSTFNISRMPGMPEIEAEVHIKAVGFRAGVDGEWVVDSVTHTITDSGYTCSVECEAPGAGKNG